ncbi:MAG: ComEC family competence protein [Dorea sp.]|nr:ComEC family competence protein [Dorea sp.]MCI9272210.1 ComEC family competence protein [Dorea sp.]
MKDRPFMYSCLVLLAIITLAVTCGKGKFIRELRPSPLESAVPPKGLAVLQGQVYQTEQRSDYQRLYLKNNSIRYQNQTFQESRIIIYTDSELQIHIGNTVRARGEVSFFENARNPGNFDQKRYYQIRDIHGMIWADEISLLDTGVWKWRSGIADFRRRWQEALVSALGREDGTALGAMMLGEKSEMDQELKMLYQVNGIGHILAKKCTNGCLCV